MPIPLDPELVAGAQAGDAVALGALLARHRAGMLAVAAALLGHRPEAEDAVQDATLTALARIGELRDPSAAGPWLRSIVRNNCLMILRKRPRAALPEGLAHAMPDAQELLERHTLKAWIFRALDALSEPLQLTLLLRYFTDVTSYEDIAAVSGVPVGTVRSRLAEAKRKLAEKLLADASARYADLEERTARRAREAAHVVAEAERGRFSQVATLVFDPCVTIVGPSADWGTDLGFLAYVFDHDGGAGVRHVLRNVVAGERITLWEMDLVSPACDPTHCPPSIVWAHFALEGRTRHLRLFHAPR